jgi:ribose transport system substrate-binding protein
MKIIFIHFLSAVILVSGMQSLVFPQEKIKIAIIPKSSVHVYWKSVQSGVKLGAFALSDVEILWRPPSIENDKAQQISIVDQCVKEGVSGIILAPLGYDALAGSVTKAMKKKIPVLIFDSALKGTAGKDFISLVITDNKKGGSLAGEKLVQLLGGNGNVVVLGYAAGQVTAKERIDGFLEVMAKYKGMQVIVKNPSAGGVEEAQKVSLSIKNELKQANGIFCPNESTTMGMLLVLRSLSLAGKIKFVGFDTTIPLIEALKAGEINGLIAQDPARMGFYSIKTMVDYVRGKKVPLKVDIDVHLITSENLNDSESQNLLALPSATK